MNSSVLANWHETIRHRSIKGLNSLFADNISLFPPNSYEPKKGKKAAITYLSGAFKVFFNETYHYVREIEGNYSAALEFEVLISGIPINGVDLIKWNEQGRIVELKVMLRPIQSVNLVHKNIDKIMKKKADNSSKKT